MTWIRSSPPQRGAGALKAKEKEVSSLLEQVRLYVELDFDIPAVLKLKHIKYRFGRVRKESFPQLQAFADRSDETILFKCHESDNYISLLYFTPDITSDRIDTVFSSMQFERIYLPDEYAGTPKTEVERLENELAKSESKGAGAGRKRFRIPADETDQSPGCQPGAEII